MVGEKGAKAPFLTCFIGIFYTTKKIMCYIIEKNDKMF